MRFAVAREQGLTEEQVAEIDDEFEESVRLAPRDRAILAYTDAIIGDPGRATAAIHARLGEHLDEGQVSELTLGIGLFLALSKVLIILGLEPERMETTVLPTPGSVARA